MSLCSRADLLRCLSHSDKQNSSALGHLLGYERRTDTNIFTAPADTTSDVHAASSQPAQAVMLYKPRREPRYWYVAACEKINDKEPDQSHPLPLPEINPGTDTPQLYPTRLPSRPIYNTGQWQNCWDGALPAQRSSRVLDLPKTVKLLARNCPVKRLPTRYRQHFNHPTVLILERSPALRPVWGDMLEARLSLRRLLGNEQLHSVYLPGDPAGAWYQCENEQATDASDIPAGAVIVLMGAFGALQNGRISASWRRFLLRLKNRGHSVVLLPVCPIQQALVNLFPLDARPAQQLQSLLTALSQAWLASTVQLRYLCQAVGGSLADELLAYNHTSTQRDGEWVNLKADALWPRLQAFKQLDQNLRQAIQHTIQAWQSSLTGMAQQAEKLQSHLADDAQPKDYKALYQLAAQAAQQMSANDEVGMSYLLMRSILPMTPILADHGSPGWHNFLQVAQQIALAENRPLPLMQQGLQQDSVNQWLRQLGNRLVLSKQKQGALLGLSQQPVHRPSRQIPGASIQPVGDTLEIVDQGHHWQLKAQAKPVWAERIWQNKQGLFAAHATGAVFQLQPATQTQPRHQWVCRHLPWQWAAQAGVDQYGLWADIQIKAISHRLRWIPSGEFMRGSPPSEPDRDDDEMLHPVTISQGFWLGETSCTQALWQAVMGDNPSHNRDQQLPVESVSWNDCRQLMDKLNRLIPALDWSLPTEAQWEYACRAGTRSAYWWGSEFEEKYANNSNSIKIEADYPANGWGLKSMSGNVFEWCADCYAEYAGGPQVDPAGPQGGRNRVLRGGCWIFSGRNLRSAYRNPIAPDDRDRSTGLRLAGGLDPKASQSPVAGQTADGWPPEGQQGSGQHSDEGA